MDSIPTITYIPTIGTAASNDEKAETFRSTFFPQLPPADLNDIQTAIYPEAVPTPPTITPSQIRTAIEKLARKKAPGPDEISNLVLKKCYDEIKDYLLLLAQESLEMGHFPKAFKESITLVFRKPKKPDYTKPNAYRLIALESTIGKVLESIVAETISYLTETHGLLLDTHFGGRPCRTAEDAMMLLTENIHSAWREKMVHSAVFMDISGVFNNVHHKRLIHNLRKRRIPEPLVRWIESFLQNRTTWLNFNGTRSPSFPTPAGIPQGSPLSSILYIYYNADLLEIQIPGTTPHLSLGFIDDIGYGVKSITTTGTIAKLEKIMAEAEQW